LPILQSYNLRGYEADLSSDEPVAKVLGSKEIYFPEADRIRMLEGIH
jgi:hypothetical protein